MQRWSGLSRLGSGRQGAGRALQGRRPQTPQATLGTRSSQPHHVMGGQKVDAAVAIRTMV